MVVLVSKKAEKMLDAWESTPVINIGWMSGDQFTVHELDVFTRDLMRMHHELRPCVESLTNRLGKRDYRWRGSEFFFHVWEDPDHKWRVFAHDHHGVSFEVNTGLSKTDALNAFYEFMKKTGVM